MYVDIAFIADPRFPGGTSTALEAEIAAAHQAGLSAALVGVKSPILRKSWPLHPGISAAINRGDVAIVPRGMRVSCTFAILHHPMVFETLPTEPLGISAEIAVLVLHHPPQDGLGLPEYDLDRILTHIEIAIGMRPVLAPVGPLVRVQLTPGATAGAAVTTADWYNLIDPEAWPARRDRPLREPIRIGRHSRPQAVKWPARLEEATAAYPERDDVEIAMLGADRAALIRAWGRVPEHWHLLEFGSLPVPDFLKSLDFWVYFHAPSWVEAFGRAILEAAVTGLVVILPEHFRPLFGPAAIYCAPHEVSAIIDQFRADPARYTAQSRRARSHAIATFGLDQLADRLSTLRPGWQARRGARPVSRPAKTPSVPTRALFMTSNGVGLGHLTRLLAIADALPCELEPVFFTLSQAAGLIAEAGYPCEYRPFHRQTGADLAPWNAVLAEEVTDALAFWNASCVVFDGNVPYDGLYAALARQPSVTSIWVRRAFWNEGHRKALYKASIFDAVIEPGELAAAMDNGPTLEQRGDVHVVPPIIRGAPAARLSRADARAALGLSGDDLIGLMSLGSEANFDLSRVRSAVCAWAGSRPRTRIVDLVSYLAKAPVVDESGGVEVLQKYPIFPFTNAFDFQIAACGYNSFHEAIAAELPTIFVPNEAGEMDLQLRRAHFAELRGAALVLRAPEALRAGVLLDRIASPETRQAMAAACRSMAWENGAAAAADFIRDYSGLRPMHPVSSIDGNGV